MVSVGICGRILILFEAREVLLYSFVQSKVVYFMGQSFLPVECHFLSWNGSFLLTKVGSSLIKFSSFIDLISLGIPALIFTRTSRITP